MYAARWVVLNPSVLTTDGFLMSGGRLKSKYTVRGMVGGLVFPLLSLPIGAVDAHGAVSPEGIWQVATTDPVQWIVLTLPVVFALIAWHTGAKHDELLHLLESPGEGPIPQVVEPRSTRFEFEHGVARSPEPEVAIVSIGADRAVPVRRSLPLRILMAEDNASDQRVGSHMLSKLGYDVSIVGNGADAVSRLQSEVFDVVLMDMHMPVLDGVHATRQIRALPQITQPWIVALTANAQQADRDACLTAGMDDHLSKPVRTEELSDALARALSAVSAEATEHRAA